MSAKDCGRYLRYSDTYATSASSASAVASDRDVEAVTIGGAARQRRTRRPLPVRWGDGRPARHPLENGLGLLPLGPDPVHRGTSPTDARHRTTPGSRDPAL